MELDAETNSVEADAESGASPITIKRLSVSQGKSAVGTIFCSAQELTVNVEYRINQPVKDLLLGVDVLSADGVPVFRTYDFERSGMATRTNGEYCSTLNIPPGIFKNEVYSIELIVGIHRAGWLSRGKLRVRVSFENASHTDVHYCGVVNSPGAWEVKSLAGA